MTVKGLKVCLSTLAFEICLSVLTPCFASAQVPATPQEWQQRIKQLDERRRDAEVSSASYLEHIKYVGVFKRTTNSLDLSKYSPDEIYYHSCGPLNVSRKTKVIITPYITLVKIKEFPAPTMKDRLMDFYGEIYSRLNHIGKVS